MRSNRQISRGAAAQLDLHARVNLEMLLTDAEAENVALDSVPDIMQLESYRSRSPWRRALFDFLGLIAGRSVLDLGCGYNPTPVYFALAGARRVLACDVSPRALTYVQEMAEAANVADRVSVVLCAGEELPLANESIDLIHGEGVLHHLLLPLAGAEIARVLSQEGRAAFKDPLGENPLLEFARDYLSYSWKTSVKGTDRPLVLSDIREFGRFFSAFSYEGFGFFSMFANFIWGRARSRPLEIAHKLDEGILHMFPFLQRYCRFVVICVGK